MSAATVSPVKTALHLLPSNIYLCNLGVSAVASVGAGLYRALGLQALHHLDEYDF